MVARPIRVALLALAAWAVLFAPGAAGTDGVDRSTLTPADRVAASVIAPTFGPDGLVLARAPRNAGDGLPDLAHLAILPAAVAVAGAAFMGGMRVSARSPISLAPRSSQTARAPPMD